MSDRGSQVGKFRFQLRAMPKACRDLAERIREEGRPVAMNGEACSRTKVSATHAADSLIQQAERWEHEIRTGEPNERDRRAIGEWHE